MTPRRGIAVMALVWVLLPSAPARADDAEAKAAAVLQELSGRLERDEKASGKPVIKVDLSYTQATDAALIEVKVLKNLQTLDLENTKVTDEGLKELENLKSLHTLNLGHTKVTDVGLKELKDLKGLQTLNLGNTKVTDAGLKELKNLKSLQQLELRSTQISDAGLKELKHFSELQNLDLLSTQVTDEGLKELKDFKSLQVPGQSHLNACPVCAAALIYARELSMILRARSALEEENHAKEGNAVVLRALRRPARPTDQPDASARIAGYRFRGRVRGDFRQQRFREHGGLWEGQVAVVAKVREVV